MWSVGCFEYYNTRLMKTTVTKISPLRWSYGITLWEICTLGGEPYAGYNNVETMEKLRSGYRLQKPPSCNTELWDFVLCFEQTFWDSVDEMVISVESRFRYSKWISCWLSWIHFSIWPIRSLSTKPYGKNWSFCWTVSQLIDYHLSSLSTNWSLISL